MNMPWYRLFLSRETLTAPKDNISSPKIPTTPRQQKMHHARQNMRETTLAFCAGTCIIYHGRRWYPQRGNAGKGQDNEFRQNAEFFKKYFTICWKNTCNLRYIVVSYFLAANGWCRTGVRHQPRYALMREVAAAPIGADGFFRGVCPILEPGERITETKGYVRCCILRRGPMFTLLCNDSFRENCVNTVHRILSCEVVEHPETCVIYRLA